MRLPSRTPVDVGLELAVGMLRFIGRRMIERTGISRIRRSL